MSQVTVLCTSRQKKTQPNYRSPSTPKTNPSRSCTFVQLSISDISSPRPIQNFFSFETFDNPYLVTTSLVERHVEYFRLNSSAELPPSFQIFLTSQRKTQSFNFLSNGFDSENTPEPDGIVKKAPFKSYSSNKKLKENNFLMTQKQNSNFQYMFF